MWYKNNVFYGNYKFFAQKAVGAGSSLILYQYN